MRGGENMKKIIAVILLMAIMLLSLSSCSWLGFGTMMPEVTVYAEFGNDVWLIIDHCLINNQDGSVTILDANTETAEMPNGVWDFYYYGPYAYKYVFEESSFKEYTYLKTASTKSGETLYYECVFTYGYDGKEISRSYIGEPLTEEEMEIAYKSNPSNVKDFTFEIDLLWKIHKKQYDDSQKQAVINYAEELYNKQIDEHSDVMGVARRIGDEIWFSIVVSDATHYNTGDGLIEGANNPEIKRYNAKTNEFTTVYKHTKKRAQIIDFDENGAYIFDSKGNLSYIDFETKKPTLIYTFSENVYNFKITDKYISAIYGNSIGGNLLVCEKGGAIIANDKY